LSILQTNTQGYLIQNHTDFVSSSMADPDYFSDPFRTSPLDGLSPNEPLAGITLKVGGLGTIATKAGLPKESISFTMRSEQPKTQPTLTLKITRTGCVLYKRDTDSGTDKPVAGCEYPKGEKAAYLNTATKDDTVYWISVDRSNHRFRYGQHLTNASMTYLQVVFEEKTSSWMDKLKTTDVEADGIVSPHLSYIHPRTPGLDRS
jgi:hypothetical protein